MESGASGCPVTSNASYVGNISPCNRTWAGLANLRHAEGFPWRTAFNAVPIFIFLLPDCRLYIVNILYKHVSDSVQTVYELPLLPNNTSNETSLHKSGAVRSFYWIFIIGVPAWQWRGEYVTLDRASTVFFSNRKWQRPQLLPYFLPYRIPRGGLYWKYNNYIMH